MIIHGFQKLTLLDYPAHTACTVFTGGCNMRCPFCHNADLVLQPNQFPVVPEEEVFDLLKKRKKKIDGVCITGGEPLLNKDLGDFAFKIKALGFSVKIDTNGSFPKELKYLAAEGLVDYVAMDIKNTLKKYPLTTGVPHIDLQRITESVDFLKSCALPHEFRTTVSRTFHSASDLSDIAAWLGKDQPYFWQQFKDSGGIMDSTVQGYAPSEMKAMWENLKESYPLLQLRGVD